MWTVSNLVIMLAHATLLGLQKLFLVKHIVVGYLRISPLLGAAMLQKSLGGLVGRQIVGGGSTLLLPAVSSSARLLTLSVVGICLGTARDIVKDIKAVDAGAGG